MMLKVFHYRLYPTKAQKKELNKTLELCRWTYNETLAIRKNAWEYEQKRISYYDSKKMIPIWKKDKPELKEVHSQVLQEVVKRVDLAFQAFFVSSSNLMGFQSQEKYNSHSIYHYHILE